MKKVTVQRIVGVILTLCVMAFIFSMSAQNAEVSSETSGGVIELAANLFYPEFSGLDETEQNSIVASLQGIVRSTAHFSIFAVLCFSSLIFTLTLEKLKVFGRYASSVVFSFLYAVSDEIHQLFVPGRSFQFIDIFVDTLGIFLGATVMYLIMKLIKKQIKKRVLK